MPPCARSARRTFHPLHPRARADRAADGGERERSYAQLAADSCRRADASTSWSPTTSTTRTGRHDVPVEPLHIIQPAVPVVGLRFNDTEHPRRDARADARFPPRPRPRIWRVGQAVFDGGRSCSDAYAPSWLTEGLAVYFESRLTGSGRLLGSEHRMIARSTALEHRVPRLDQLSLATPRFPGGQAAYAYGSLIVDHLARTRGPSRVRDLVERTSGQLIPFLLDRPASRGFGTTFSARGRAPRLARPRGRRAATGRSRAGGISPRPASSPTYRDGWATRRSSTRRHDPRRVRRLRRTSESLGAGARGATRPSQQSYPQRRAARRRPPLLATRLYRPIPHPLRPLCRSARPDASLDAWRAAVESRRAFRRLDRCHRDCTGRYAPRPRRGRRSEGCRPHDWGARSPMAGAALVAGRAPDRGRDLAAWRRDVDRRARHAGQPRAGGRRVALRSGIAELVAGRPADSVQLRPLGHA